MIDLPSVLSRAFRYVLPPFAVDAGRWLCCAFRRHKHYAPRDGDVELEKMHRRLNQHVEAGQITIREGTTFRIHPESRLAFEYFCFRSPDMVRELDAFLSETAGSSRLLDIGALHGIFSLAFAATANAQRVIAIDASPLAFATLLYNVHANQFTNIEPIECAVTDKPGTLSMHYEWQHAVATHAADGTPGFSVPADTGDRICLAHQFDPDIIKIDVEGHEIKVLKGLIDTISRCRPLIFLEMHPVRISREGDSLADLHAFLDAVHYDLLCLDGAAVDWARLLNSTTDERLIIKPRPQH